MQSTPQVPGPVNLSDVQKTTLHRAACRLIDATARSGPMLLEDFEIGGLASVPVVGVFVTLRKNGQLRGCIGNFSDAIPLQDALYRAAKGAAAQDPRFPPVAPEELSELTVEISLLHSRWKLGPMPRDRIDGIEIGRHGLDIRCGRQSGLLLPQVPVELGWEKQQLLEHVGRKAGLSPDTWQNPEAELFRFEATYFGGPFELDPLAG